MLWILAGRNGGTESQGGVRPALSSLKPMEGRPGQEEHPKTSAESQMQQEKCGHSCLWKVGWGAREGLERLSSLWLDFWGNNDSEKNKQE